MTARVSRIVARLLTAVVAVNALLCACRPAVAAHSARAAHACCAAKPSATPGDAPPAKTDCPHCRPVVTTATSVAVPSIDFALPQAVVGVAAWVPPPSPVLSRRAVDSDASPPASTLLRLHCALNA